MEDAATAEISRAQIWQWIKFKVYLNNGEQVNKKYFFKILNEELKNLKIMINLRKQKKYLLNSVHQKNLLTF